MHLKEPTFLCRQQQTCPWQHGTAEDCLSSKKIYVLNLTMTFFASLKPIAGVMMTTSQYTQIALVKTTAGLELQLSSTREFLSISSAQDQLVHESPMSDHGLLYKGLINCLEAKIPEGD